MLKATKNHAIILDGIAMCNLQSLFHWSRYEITKKKIVESDLVCNTDRLTNHFLISSTQKKQTDALIKITESVVATFSGVVMQRHLSSVMKAVIQQVIREKVRCSIPVEA